MNLNESYSSSNSLCMGCLSVERKLTPINYPELTTILCDLISCFSKSQTILLCWECTALMSKVVKFRRRAKLASKHLLYCTLNNTKPLTLSNLKRGKTEILDCFENGPEVKDSIDNNSTVQTQSLLSLEIEKSPDNKILQKSRNYTHKESQEGLENGDCFPYLNESLYSEGTQSQNAFTFIKVEDDEYDDNIVDDNIHQNGCEDLDEKDFKTFIKQDPEIEHANREPVKLKADAELDFNESDEEPLNTKKNRKESKKRVKGGVSSDEVGRRKVKGKGEQQAGVVRHARVARILRQLNVDSSQVEMVVLGWDEIADERHRATQKVAYTRHKYKCEDCVLGFNHRSKLENHLKKHDECSGKMVCPVCKIRCKDDAALRAHKRRHRVRWRCCICGDLSSRAPVAADHVSRTHGAPMPTHVCKMCGHRESSLGKLRSHMKDHGERPKCDLCGKTFRDRASLRTHLFIHKGEKEYSCPRCGKRFLFKKAMEVHMVTHDASAHLYCHQCDVSFKNRMSYSQHMKYNLRHIDPAKLKYACKLCDKKFSKAKRLEEHNMAVHLNAKPVHCTVQGCSFTCSSRPVLRTHVRMVHRNARAQRNHVCHACGKAYTTKKTLEGHLRSHSGERPFRCSICPSNFGYEAALYNHNKLVHLKAKVGKAVSHNQLKEADVLNEIS